MQPSWYRDTEKWLLRNGGREAIALGLVGVIAVSSVFLVAVWVDKKWAVPAAAWVTYLYMP